MLKFCIFRTIVHFLIFSEEFPPEIRYATRARACVACKLQKEDKRYALANRSAQRRRATGKGVCRRFTRREMPTGVGPWRSSARPSCNVEARIDTFLWWPHLGGSRDTRLPPLPDPHRSRQPPACARARVYLLDKFLTMMQTDFRFHANCQTNGKIWFSNRSLTGYSCARRQTHARFASAKLATEKEFNRRVDHEDGELSARNLD